MRSARGSDPLPAAARYVLGAWMASAGITGTAEAQQTLIAVPSTESRVLPPAVDPVPTNTGHRESSPYEVHVPSNGRDTAGDLGSAHLMSRGGATRVRLSQASPDSLIPWSPPYAVLARARQESGTSAAMQPPRSERSCRNVVALDALGGALGGALVGGLVGAVADFGATHRADQRRRRQAFLLGGVAVGVGFGTMYALGHSPCGR